MSGEAGRGERARRTRAALEQVPDIPALPPVLVTVWELTAREETSAADLAKAMSADPGLTGAILRLANSAYFGFPRRVATVKQAVVVLGFDTVKSLAMGASVFRALGRGEDGGLDPAEFFRHSLVTAMAARMLVERRRPQDAGTAFCAGILHDLGRLVICEFLPQDARKIAAASGNGRPWEEAEEGVLGLGHAEIGAWFAARWNFPEELAAALRWHHAPEGADGHELLAAAVHVADAVAYRTGSGGGRPDPPVPEPAALATLGLAADDLGALEERVREASAEAPAAAETIGVGA